MSPQEAADELQYLLRFNPYPETVEALTLAIAALEREAKAEPVAWAYVNPDGECEQIEWGPVFDDPHVTPLYASPPPPAQMRDTPEGLDQVRQAYIDGGMSALGPIFSETWERQPNPYRPILEKSLAEAADFYVMGVPMPPYCPTAAPPAPETKE